MKILSRVIIALVLIAIIAVGALIYTTCSGSPLIQRIDKTLPDASVAPFQVATMTRTYQAERAVLNDNGTVTMWGWYEKDGGKWLSLIHI